MEDHLTAGIRYADGPVAPRDPAVKLNGIYIMYESMVEGVARPDGTATKEIYLEGRISEQARYTGGITDEAMLEMLKTSSGFRQLVHSIGVSVRADKAESGNVLFSMQHWAKNNKFEAGTRMTTSCPTDGSETILVLDEFEWSPYDDVPGKFVFEFEHAGDLAVASVMFYLNEGYEAPQATVEPPVEFGSPNYRRMIEKSILHQGNTLRLKKAIDKARRGEEVTIAYIGGSITQGAGAVPFHSNSYVYKSYDLFAQMFGREGISSIHLIKAGVGGTPSELGIVRYERDVLRDGTVCPDIVVIEFAVNDGGDETRGNCYESLVLKALGAANKPAVILLFSVFANDWNLQDRLAPVGWHYNLPMVSVKDAVVEQFPLTKAQGNVISKKQFFYDIYHPANAGHQVMADCLGLLFEAADRSVPEKDIATDIPPVIGNDFVNLRLLDRRTAGEIAQIEPGGFVETDIELQMVEMDADQFWTPQFPNNWMHTMNSGTDSFKMSIWSKRLILVFKDSGSAEFGSAEIWVNGRHVKTADPHVNNWTHCNATVLYSEEEESEHLIEIKMAPGQEGKRFSILGFGYVI